jgi:hypothetical protein
MKVLLVFFALLVPAMAANPSDLITIDPRPGLIELSGASGNSLVAIDNLNSNLTPFQMAELVDLGHYYSGVRESAQTIEAISPIQLEFANAIEDLPANVGNATNATLVTNATNGLIWVV